jgi:uncharacterized membrane protein
MIELETLARGDASRIVERRRSLVRSADEWRTLWALHAGPDSAAPAVDFDTRVVAAAFAGEKPTSGYAIEIGARGNHDGVWLATSERAPSPGAITAQILTVPFHIVSLPRPAGEVRWADSAAAPVPVSASSTSSTGLMPRTASALAYLAGPFSGALMLLAESRNVDVRFHAWQSIIALGGLGLGVVLFYVLAVASLFVSATAVSLLVRIATAIWVTLIVVWAICLWKAWQGGRWKLPLAGDWANRKAER